MKTICKIIFMAVLALSTFSCDEFLEEDPKGRLAQSTFFGSENDLDLSLNSLYKRIAYRNASNQYMAHMWGGDDISTHPASNKQDFREFDRYIVSDNSTRLHDEWTATYQVIKAANYIINNAGRLTGGDERLNAKVGTTIAQAAYWRAYAYFQLTRCWGKVPLVLADDMNYEEPLASEEEIFNQIIADLKLAETDLPAQWTGTPWSMNGRNIAVSQGAAKATLAYVYLSFAGWPFNKTEYYAQAASKAREVIDASDRKDQGYYYELLDEYWKVYSWTYNNDNPEVLLATYYSMNWPWDESAMSTYCDVIEDVDGGSHGGGWNDSGAEIRFWKNFPEGPRKEATFAPKTLLKGVLQDWWWDPGYGTADGRVVCNPWYLAACEGDRGTEFDYTKGNDQGDMIGEKSHKAIRLSEVYCWYAEATGRSGGNDPFAYEVLNRVRTRAGLEPIANGSLSSESLAEAAYDEHGWEIAGYYWGSLAPRYHDLFRMNRVKDHFEFRKQNPEIEVAPGVFRKEKIEVTGTWDDSKMYAPYPAADAMLNPNLKR
ncbi:MAG: RagB/SusD family nutrient uptake outer membrane protein [Tannerella sp.]|nr:RagB/SusD family nutrient uptake outer membrane protein [Tannerella sp.]